MKKEIILTSIISITFTILLMGVFTYVLSWQEPTSTLPTNYITPLNTGAEEQAKTGNLSLGTIYNVSGTRYLNLNGNSILEGDICSDSLGFCFSDVEGMLGAESFLYNYNHTISSCESLGGTVVSAGSESICKLSASSCPSGWMQYLNYSTTTVKNCQNTTYYTGGSDACDPCTTGSHSFSNVAQETCLYEAISGLDGFYCGDGDAHTNCSSLTSYGWQPCTCSAPIVEIGCY